MFRALVNVLGISAIVAVLGACDAGGNNVAGIDGSGAPIAANVSTGTIDGFGSVIVNGVRYDTSLAAITVSGDVSNESDLGVGAYVTVLGQVNQDGISGTAAQIIFQPNVVGVISSINLAQDSFVVLGQTVKTNSETSFDPDISGNGLAGLSVDDRIRVSGRVNAADEIIASRIDLVTTTELEVLGEISSLDRNAMTFNIGTVVIDFSQAVLEELDPLDLSNGDRLVVEGVAFDGTTLVATFIEIEESYFDQVDELSEIEWEGLITEFRSLNSFVVANIEVSASDNTEVSGGDLSDLGLNIFVEVEGTFNSQNVLDATHIELIEFDSQIISGFVTDVDVTSEDSIPIGSLVVQGISVVTSLQTRYEDESEASESQFNLTHINVGDFLEVVGESNGEGFVASGIERLGVEGLEEVLIQGPLEREGETYFLHGYTLEFGLEVALLINDEEVAEELFFAEAEGGFAEALGRVEGDVFVVTAINLVLE